MPCTYWLPGEQESTELKVALRESDAYRDKLKDDLDRLTAENDSLRETILAMSKGETLSKYQLKKIEKAQIDHRKEDLARLKKTFTEKRDATRLGKVMLADPKKPLKDQLGFDPDDF